jgi:hypothetical protein
VSRHLFIGGPRGGTWHDVPESYGPTVKVATLPRRSEVEFHIAAGVLMESATPEICTYYRTRVLIPGWIGPVTVYTTDPVLPPPWGTPLPGLVQGATPDCEPIGPLNWTGPTRHARALHDAVRRENHARMLARIERERRRVLARLHEEQIRQTKRRHGL